MKINRFHVLLLLAVILYFANLGGSSIYILDEAKNASCAMEMKAAKEWIVPTFNGSLRTDKPPLHYYAMMMAYAIGGVSPLSARFFSALSGVLLIIFMFRKLKKLINEDAAFYSCLVLLSSLQFTVQMHLAVPDPYLILWMTIALLYFFEGYSLNSSRAYYRMYAFVGLGFLTKGLIAVVFPGLIVFLFLLIQKRLTIHQLMALKIPAGLAIFSVVALPWYILVGYKTDGAWLQGFFLDHHINRYTSTMEGHGFFPLAPVVFLLAGTLPFSLLSFQSFRKAWEVRNHYPIFIFCMCVAGVVALFFSFSKTVLPGYIAPAIPFFSVLSGNYIAHSISNKQGMPFAISLIHLLICLLFPVGAFIAFGQDKDLEGLTRLSLILAVLPVGGILGWYFFSRLETHAGVISWMSGWMLTVVLFFYVVNPKLDQLNPVVNSRTIRAAYTDYQTVVYGSFNPAFVFEYQAVLPDLSTDELKVMASDDQKVMIITRSRYLDDLKILPQFKIIYRKRDLFENTVTVILAN